MYGVNIDEDKWWIQQIFDDVITDEEFQDGAHGNPDSYCIQKFDGEKFKCFCDELKVNPTKDWLM